MMSIQHQLNDSGANSHLMPFKSRDDKRDISSLPSDLKYKKDGQVKNRNRFAVER